MDYRDEPVLDMTPSAEKKHKKIESCLKSIVEGDYSSCLDEDFKRKYLELMDLFQEYQNELIAGSDMKMSCQRGCGTCCNHWVDDVYSFEAEIIADYVREKMPHMIDRITVLFHDDEVELSRLKEMLDVKFLDNPDECEDMDPVDLLLSCFYQLERSCAFLNSNSECSIYPVRPMVCRTYVNLGDVLNCDPDYINDQPAKTCIVDVKDEAESMLEELHFKYDRFDDERGLRSLVRMCLS